MKYAVVKIGGSQYKVAEGDQFDVEKLIGKKGSSMLFSEVLLFVENGKVSIGKPLLKGIVVEAKILDQFKGKKIRVATYKAKSRYRRVIGHRKLLTKIEVKRIGKAKAAEKSPSKKK